jgi:hypothetical protein
MEVNSQVFMGKGSEDLEFGPYSTSQQPAIERSKPFLAKVRAASPGARVIAPEYFEPILVQAQQNPLHGK